MHFLGSPGLVFGLGSGSKSFFAPYLCRLSTLVLKVQHYLLFLIRPYLGGSFYFFGLFGAIFRVFGDIFRVRVRFYNDFETDKCRLLIFVLEVQPQLFVFNSATLEAFLGYFWDLLT